MTARRLVARIVLIAIISALLTTWIGWMSLPFVGLVFGFTDRKARAHGTLAATGAMSGWLGILGASAARGDDVYAVAGRIGAVLQVPGWTFLFLTLVFAAVLCGAAAVVGNALRSFQQARPEKRAAQQRSANSHIV